MAADEEIAGHEIAGEDVNNAPILPPTTDPANTCSAYAEIEYAGACVAASGIVYPNLTIIGDTCSAYAEIEYAGACVNENAIFPNLPTTNIENFDTSVGRLGCGVPSVFITARCSSNMTCQINLSDITKLTWTRKMDEVSEAEVEIGLTGDATQTCCQCLAIVEPFCHELHIWRDGDEVWVGPIEGIRYERDRVTIKARDSLAWLDVRIPTTDVNFQTTFTGVISDNPLLAASTSINSITFNALPVVTASAPVVHVVLEDSSSTNREVVRVVTHTAASNTITVTRGQQGTTAIDHLLLTSWGSGFTGERTDITNIAEYLLFTAFSDDVASGFDCEMVNVFSTLTGTEFSWYSEAFNQSFLEILTDVAEPPGFNFTTLGRTIVLSGDIAALTPLVLLNDEHIMGEIQVTKDGKQLVNRQYVHWDGDSGIPSVGAKDANGRYCYHLIERIMDSPLQFVADADVLAQQIVNSGFIAPRILEIPDGARLSPDTPWTINQMVCGAKVNVAVTRLCLSLTQSFRLLGVTVEYTQADGEMVGITVSPINNLTDAF